MKLSSFLRFRFTSKMPLQKAVFGLQCFWGESALAKIDGVVKTRVGYAGGKAPTPTYKNIQDYTGEFYFENYLNFVISRSHRSDF